MRHRSLETSFLSLARIGILLFAIDSLAIAQRQDHTAPPDTAASLRQALTDSSAAIQRKDVADC